VKKTADQWFAEYAECHQHRVNRTIHAVCGPLILYSLLGFVWSVPVPEAWQAVVPWFNWALVGMVAILVFYIRLSPALSAGMLFFLAVGYMLIVVADMFVPWSVGNISVAVFVLAWTGLVVGRILERGAPSLARDLWLLLIGPAWLVSRIYRRVGQAY
jgi:uncharacterized membrane protein YGL010W